MRLFLPLLLLLIPVSVFPQSKAQRLLAALENQRFEAMTKKDAGFLQNVLADDLTYTHSNGLVETKAEHLGNIQSGAITYKSMQPENINVKVYGKSAVITGVVNVDGVYEGKAFALRLRYTDVYIKKKGTWKLAAWHSVRAG